MDLPNRWNEHLRRDSKKNRHDVRCPECGQVIERAQTPSATPQEGIGSAGIGIVFADLERHFSDFHAELLAERSWEADVNAFLHSQWEAAQKPSTGREVGELGMSSLEAGVKPTNLTGTDENIQLFSSRPSDRKKPVGPVSPADRDERKSLSPSAKREGSRSESPPKRPKARRRAPTSGQDSRADFDRGSYQKGQLWNPDQDTIPSRPRHYDKSNVATYHRQRPPPDPHTPRPPRQANPPSVQAAAASAAQPADEEPPQLIKQPDTRAISQEQLVAEVKGIYAGLVMVESKCIEVDNNQTSQTNPATKLSKDQWHALIALHRTLLHEHHDFFLASQHPSASPALNRLANKYAMPARMWRHGIHSFLELLRHRLPASLDYMLTFIYMAYSMMALLYETVPAFEETWIECLGDLGRYRMAIEDDDIRDREVWASVSRHWYSRASDKSPTTGRLYHHLAILARPNALQQLYYYAKSLCVEIPFLSARESIMTLFDPIMSPTRNPQQARLQPTELNFVKAHGILFSGKQMGELPATIDTFFQLLDSYIARFTRRWLDAGYHKAISNICAVTGYGNESNPITAALKAFSRLRPAKTAASAQGQSAQAPATYETAGTGNSKTATAVPSSEQFPNALYLFTGTYNIVCRRFGDPNILPYLHVTLVFVYHLTFCPDAMAHLAPHFPWKLTASMLNTLLTGSLAASLGPSAWQGADLAQLAESGQFPGGWEASKEGDAETSDSTVAAAVLASTQQKQQQPLPPLPPPRRRSRPLPDDFAMSGFPWVEKYFPEGWFETDERIDDDDKFFELPSMLEERRARVVWLGGRIAEREGGKWLRFDREAKQFGVSPEYDVDAGGQEFPSTPADSVDYGELPDVGIGV